MFFFISIHSAPPLLDRCEESVPVCGVSYFQLAFTENYVTYRLLFPNCHVPVTSAIVIIYLFPISQDAQVDDMFDSWVRWKGGQVSKTEDSVVSRSWSGGGFSGS